jgi:hypothetical protein
MSRGRGPNIQYLGNLDTVDDVPALKPDARAVVAALPGFFFLHTPSDISAYYLGLSVRASAHIW